MQQHNYTLILFEKDKENTPKVVGQKAITKEQYKELTDDMFTSFAVGDITWLITERRWFYREDAICVNFYVVIDAINNLDL